MRTSRSLQSRQVATLTLTLTLALAPTLTLTLTPTLTLTLTLTLNPNPDPGPDPNPDPDPNRNPNRYPNPNPYPYPALHPNPTLTPALLPPADARRRLRGCGVGEGADDRAARSPSNQRHPLQRRQLVRVQCGGRDLARVVAVQVHVSGVSVLVNCN